MEENIQSLLTQVISVSFLLIALSLFFIIQDNCEFQLNLLSGESSEINAVMSSESTNLITKQSVKGYDIRIQIVKGLEHPIEIDVDGGSVLSVLPNDDYTQVSMDKIPNNADYFVEYQVDTNGDIKAINYTLE